jgi:hypothetical protein
MRPVDNNYWKRGYKMKLTLVLPLIFTKLFTCNKCSSCVTQVAYLFLGRGKLL